MAWEKQEDSAPVVTYYDGDMEMIHILRTGSKDKYAVIHDDALQENLGVTHILTKREIKEVYGIELSYPDFKISPDEPKD